MNTWSMETLDLERFRDSDFPSGGLEHSTGGDSSGATQYQSTGNADGTKTDNADAEREERLERWMDQIKLFIRNIDINSL